MGCGTLATVGVENLDTAAETRRTVNVALLDESCQDGTYPVSGGNLEMVADFPDGRGHVVFPGILLDVFVNFGLAIGQVFFLA